MYQRYIAEVIQKSKKSILLLGPRQVGKSTLILNVKPELVINLAREDEYFTFQENVNELEERINSKMPKTVFIDEIQRIPRLLNTIQAIIDENPKLKFYLTGSSARKLRKGKANLLPGRIFSYYLAPLSPSEMAEDWNELHALRFGSLPGVLSLESEADKKKLLQSYSNTYLKEEILAEALVRGVDGFVRFLKEAAIQSGDFLDLSKLAKKSKIPRQSTVRHFEILEDTLIAKKIENDPDLEDVDLIKHPRFFFFDLGVCNALRGSFDASGDRIGNLFEHMVFNQVINSATARDIEIEAYNLRTRGGFEVDFIFKINSKKFAVECKSALKVDESDVKNLKQLGRFYKKIEPVLIYRGKVEKKISGVWSLPLPKALEVMGL